MDRVYHQGGHRSSRHIKPCCQETKIINPTNEEVIVVPDFGRTHSIATSPQEKNDTAKRKSTYISGG